MVKQKQEKMNARIDIIEMVLSEWFKKHGEMLFADLVDVKDIPYGDPVLPKLTRKECSL